MRSRSKFAVLGVVMVFACAIFAAAVEKPKLQLTVLYDNWVAEEGTEADWGFSVLVERGVGSVLFDTGREDYILRHNLRKLRVDLTKIHSIVLSHDHGDHTGGLFTVLTRRREARVYMPASFPRLFSTEVDYAGADVIRVVGAMKVADGMHLTGELGDEIKEQALVVETSEGLVLITGCAHPGIVEMTRHVVETFEQPVTTVLGGFHLMNHSVDEVKEVIDSLKELGVRSAGPSHCSGEKAVDLFRAAYGESFVALGTGRVVTID